LVAVARFLPGQAKDLSAPRYVYMNLFICFSVNNPPLKLVLAFQIRLVRMVGTT